MMSKRNIDYLYLLGDAENIDKVKPFFDRLQEELEKMALTIPLGGRQGREVMETIQQQIQSHISAGVIKDARVEISYVDGSIHISIETPYGKHIKTTKYFDPHRFLYEQYVYDIGRRLS